MRWHDIRTHPRGPLFLAFEALSKRMTFRDAQIEKAEQLLQTAGPRPENASRRWLALAFSPVAYILLKAVQAFVFKRTN